MDKETARILTALVEKTQPPHVILREPTANAVIAEYLVRNGLFDLVDYNRCGKDIAAEALNYGLQKHLNDVSAESLHLMLLSRKPFLTFDILYALLKQHTCNAKPLSSDVFYVVCQHFIASSTQVLNPKRLFSIGLEFLSVIPAQLRSDYCDSFLFREFPFPEWKAVLSGASKSKTYDPLFLPSVPIDEYVLKSFICAAKIAFETRSFFASVSSQSRSKALKSRTKGSVMGANGSQKQPLGSADFDDVQVGVEGLDEYIDDDGVVGSEGDHSSVRSNQDEDAPMLDHTDHHVDYDLPAVSDDEDEASDAGTMEDKDHEDDHDDDDDDDDDNSTVDGEEDSADKSQNAGSHAAPDTVDALTEHFLQRIGTSRVSAAMMEVCVEEGQRIRNEELMKAVFDRTFAVACLLVCPALTFMPGVLDGVAQQAADDDYARLVTLAAGIRRLDALFTHARINNNTVTAWQQAAAALPSGQVTSTIAAFASFLPSTAMVASVIDSIKVFDEVQAQQVLDQLVALDLTDATPTLANVCRDMLLLDRPPVTYSKEQLDDILFGWTVVDIREYAQKYDSFVSKKQRKEYLSEWLLACTEEDAKQIRATPAMHRCLQKLLSKRKRQNLWSSFAKLPFPLSVDALQLEFALEHHDRLPLLRYVLWSAFELKRESVGVALWDVNVQSAVYQMTAARTAVEPSLRTLCDEVLELTARTLFLFWKAAHSQATAAATKRNNKKDSSADDSGKGSRKRSKDEEVPLHEELQLHPQLSLHAAFLGGAFTHALANRYLPPCFPRTAATVKHCGLTRLSVPLNILAQADDDSLAFVAYSVDPPMDRETYLCLCLRIQDPDAIDNLVRHAEKEHVSWICDYIQRPGSESQSNLVLFSAALIRYRLPSSFAETLLTLSISRGHLSVVEALLRKEDVRLGEHSVAAFLSAAVRTLGATALEACTAAALHREKQFIACAPLVVAYAKSVYHEILATPRMQTVPIVKKMVRFTDAVRSLQQQLKKTAVYILPHVVGGLKQSAMPEGDVKREFLRSVWALMDMCGEDEFAEVNVLVVDAAGRDVWRSLYHQYDKFHRYKGKA
jgi:hypothetical protein